MTLPPPPPPPPVPPAHRAPYENQNITGVKINLHSNIPILTVMVSVDGLENQVRMMIDT